MLFTESPRNNNYGITLSFKNGSWNMKFNGCFNFANEFNIDEISAYQFKDHVASSNDFKRHVMEKDFEKKFGKERYDKAAQIAEKAWKKVEQSPITTDKDYL